MQFQTLFDSVCRCFGHVTTSPSGAGQASAASQPITDSSSQSSVKRRTNRLELKDREWDELFDGSKAPENGKIAPKAAFSATAQSRNDLVNAQAVANAKLAANPSRHRSKRKRSGKSRDDIFRNRDGPMRSHQSQNAQQTTFSRLLNPSVALCFATPIRGTEEEPEETALRSSDNSDTNTLNTCEDTITSTVYFDSKYSHVVETRPPMPLFNQFKLGDQKDEISNIVATDSHSSLKMIRLLRQAQEETAQPVHLEDSSSDSDKEHPNGQTTATDLDKMDVEECAGEEHDDVPDVKAMSSSTDSSRQTIHSARSSSSQSQKRGTSTR